MTREEFDRLYLDKAVHCDTKEKANHFLALADSVGYKWKLGQSLIGNNFWEECEKETCYRVQKRGLTYSDTIHYNSHGYQIIEYEPQSKFKEGDKVRVNNTLFTTINGKVGVIESVDSLNPMLYHVKINDADSLVFWYFYENQLEKVEESTNKEETTESIIDEIKTKWSEINILLNRLEKKEKKVE